MSTAMLSGPHNKDKHNNMTRRQFLIAGAVATAGMALPVEMKGADKNQVKKAPKGSAFTVWQIPSHSNTIGNSYVFRTRTGKVIVMDGGFPEEAYTLRGFVGALGNEVEAWFISHPHDDHMGALSEILKQGMQDLRIKAIYHSSITDKVIDAEPTEAKGRTSVRLRRDETQDSERCHPAYRESLQQ